MTQRILFITGSQGWSGGTERACADLANSLASNSDTQVSILSGTNGKKSFFHVSSEIVLDEIYSNHCSLQLRAIDFTLKIRAYIKKKKPDVVIIVESFLSIFVIPACYGTKVKLINWEHFGAQISLGVPLRRLARRLAAKYCEHVIVLTNADKNLWIKKYKIEKEKISVVPNINPMYGRKRGMEKSRDSKTVIAVGRLEEEKGFDLLLNAWKKIQSGIRENWTLKIVGEGSWRERLEKLSQRLEISESVDLAGRSANIESEYQAADIFVLSSRFEGFGLVIVEAMTFGLPVVAFDCPDGPGEIIDHRRSGMLVEYLNVDALAGELESLMISPHERQNLGLTGQRSIDRYSPQAVMKAWVNVFKILRLGSLAGIDI